MFKKSWWVVVLALTAVISVLASCAPAAPPEVEKPREIQDVEYLGAAGFTSKALGAGISDIVTKHSTWIRMSMVETGGSEMNITMAAEPGRDPDSVVYSTTTNDYTASLHGVSPWKEAYPNQRLIMAFVAAPMFLGTTDPDVKTLADLKGKKVGALTGSVTTTLLEECLKDIGIRDQVEIQMLGFGAMHDALRDRMVDVMLVPVTGVPGQPFVPSAMFVEVYTALKGKVWLVDWGKENIEKAAPRVGAGQTAMLALPGTLESTSVPVYGPGNAFDLACRADASEELIYEITSLAVKYYYLLRDYVATARFVSPESMVKLLPIESEAEVHPGALKYYKETGLWKAREEGK